MLLEFINTDDFCHLFNDGVSSLNCMAVIDRVFN
jgi:hypothetical protein